jgi:uncharacterized protein
MTGRPIWRVQDAVHGLMAFRGVAALAVDVLEAAELRRLRRIRQLGLANFAFPSAEHSRFSHSLGVAHLGVRFATELEAGAAGGDVDQRAIRDLALAGLCHDIGHGPVSHAWESVAIGKFDHVQWINALGLSDEPRFRALGWHELVGQALLRREEGELHRQLEASEPGLATRVAEMLMGAHDVSFLPRLLSSDVDIDRCDFLLRDAHQTGVGYGRFDLNWLISTLAVGMADGQPIVGFDRVKATRVVEQFLVARRAMYEMVYHHRTVRAAEATLGLFLARLRTVTQESQWSAGLDGRYEPIREIMSGRALPAAEILRLDDDLLWTLLTDIANAAPAEIDPVLADLARRVVERRLLKGVPLPDGAVFAPGLIGDVYDIVSAFTSGAERYYVHFDEPDFETAGEGEAYAGYLIDVEGAAAGKAHAMREEPIIGAALAPPAPRRRIYVPEQAVVAVADRVRAAAP